MNAPTFGIVGASASLRERMLRIGFIVALAALIRDSALWIFMRFAAT
jgi:hypothetical protein